MKDQRTLAGVRLWVAAGLSLALLAVATYALAAPPEASHRFTPAVVDVAASAPNLAQRLGAHYPGVELVLDPQPGHRPG